MFIRSLFIVMLLVMRLSATPGLGQTGETDHPPIFPGGMPQLTQFLSRNLHLPASVTACKFGGKAVVRFVVDTNGIATADSVWLDQMTFRKKKISDEEKNGAKVDLIAAIKQMISTMPNWSPGIQKGVAVQVRFRLPINIDPN